MGESSTIIADGEFGMTKGTEGMIWELRQLDNDM
jgi:hypothetical protein